MSKLIYITEAQLQEIVGNGAYLNKTDTKNEFKFGGAEVTTNGTTGNYIDGDVESGDPVTSDKLASQLVPQRSHWTRGAGQTRVNEANQEIKGLNVGLSDKSEQTAEKLGINASDMDCNYGFVVQGRIKNGEYNGKVNDEDLTQLNNDLGNKLQTKMNISRSGRQAKMARGENVLKSAPKTGAKGGAHTPKGNNVIGVSYED
jgi:hypothetical protein